MTIAELKNLAQQIKLANLTAENSAVRVGSLFEYLVNYIAQLEIAESPNGGASAYEIYVATTTDNPVLSEIEWIHSLYGEDGVTPTIGTNGNWFIGDTDTGVKAQPENPVPVMQYYNGHKNCAEAYTGSIEDIDPDYHLCDGTDVPGYGKVPDMRGMFIVGFDPRTSPVPTTEPGLIKNYGAIGNKGGVDYYKLTGPQSGVQAHDHDVPASTGTVDGTGSQQGIKPPGTIKIKTSLSVAKDATEAHENRPTYFVIAWIIRVKPLVISGVGSGIESIVAGTNVTIDVTDPKKPVLNVPVVGSSTETAPYVLSGLDADIKTGVIASHTILEKHQFTAANIYAEVSAMPEVLGIVVDVLKNGVSIFSTKPSIAAGELHSVGTHVLVTSPTIFNAGDIRSISVDQIGVGDGKTGKNLKLSILMHKII